MCVGGPKSGATLCGMGAFTLSTVKWLWESFFFFFWWGGSPFFQMIMQESVAPLKAVKSVLLVLCFHRRWLWIDSSCVFILSRYILSSLLSRILVIFSFFSSLHHFFSPSFSIVIIRLHLNVSVLVLAKLVLGLTFVDECGGGGLREEACVLCLSLLD